MIDRNKVVQAVVVCTDTELGCEHCPYFDEELCRTKLLGDIRLLVEGFEPLGMKPLTYFHGINKPFTYRCGHCHKEIAGGQHFCAGCGWKVLWE